MASAGEVEKRLRWRTRFLVRPADRELWTYLVAWARARAAAESGRALASDRGWHRGRYQRGFRRASELIAAGLNAERINAASLLAGEQAEPRLIRRGMIPAAKGRPRQDPVDNVKTHARPRRRTGSRGFEPREPSRDTG